MNTNVKIFVSVIVILMVGTIASVLLKTGPAVETGPGKYDAFAQCIKDSGAIFYGAFWCPHCQAQKKMFGSSVHLLPYFECSTPDGNGQVKECTDKGITSYPTWILKDGTRIPDDDPNGGGVLMSTLAAKTGCTLPQ